MNKADWEGLEHFNENENWGNPSKMDRKLLYLLDELRGLFHHSFIIHCGYDTKGHSKDSQHYVGKAVDFHIKGIDFKDAVDLMLGFINGLGVATEIGLGIYPHWNHPGFHIDTRGSKARWGALKVNGKQVYRSFKFVYNKI